MPVAICPSCKGQVAYLVDRMDRPATCRHCNAVFSLWSGEIFETPSETSHQPPEHHSSPPPMRQRPSQRQTETEPETVNQPNTQQVPFDSKYCQECGKTIRARAVICPLCGCAQPAKASGWQPSYSDEEDDEIPANSGRIAAGVFAIILGCLGVHKFTMGYTLEGFIMLIVSAFTCGSVSAIIGLVEGIIYLSKSDRQFHHDYIVGRKAWF